jgi:hypothetical protein
LIALQEKVAVIRQEIPQFTFFFYIVLDNVKSLLKIERQKKIVEKLSIAQSLVTAPSCFSIMVINDSLTDEIQVFREHTNVFNEYMYTWFYFAPPNED